MLTILGGGSITILAVMMKNRFSEMKLQAQGPRATLWLRAELDLKLADSTAHSADLCPALLCTGEGSECIPSPQDPLSGTCGHLNSSASGAFGRSGWQCGCRAAVSEARYAG